MDIQQKADAALAAAKARAHDAVSNAETRIGVWLHAHPGIVAAAGALLGFLVGFAVHR